MARPRTALSAPAPASGREIGPLGDRGPVLRVIPGGLNRPTVVFVRQADLDELHLELTVARAERTVLAGHLRIHLRNAVCLLAAGRPAGVTGALAEMGRLVEQEARRAQAMTIALCPCGSEGAGHGPADEGAVAVPLRRVA